MKKWLRKKFINILVKNLYQGLTEEDILILKNGGVYWHGKLVPHDRLSTIAEGAERFENSLVWKALSSEVEYQAEKRMFRKSLNYDDMMFGKAMLYNIEIIEEKMKYLKNLK